MKVIAWILVALTQTLIMGCLIAAGVSVLIGSTELLLLAAIVGGLTTIFSLFVECIRDAAGI